MYIYFRKDTRKFSHTSAEVNGGEWLLEFEIKNAPESHTYLLDDEDTVTIGDSISVPDGIPSEAEFNLQALRRARDEKLKDTDWMAVSDRVMSPDQLAYRQALRDITKNYSTVADAVWPILGKV